MFIDAMTDADVPTVVKIERASFNDPWKEAAFFDELHHRHSYSFVLRDAAGGNSSDIDAYICFHIISDEMHLLKIAVAPARRRTGIAYHLLTQCIYFASKLGIKTVFLEVRSSNTQAIDLYRKLGFKIVGIRSNYYTAGITGRRENALIMQKPIEKEIDDGNKTRHQRNG